jgi:hypothetical protein
MVPRKHHTFSHKAARNPATANPSPTPAPALRNGAIPALSVAETVVVAVTEVEPLPAEGVAEPDEQEGAVFTLISWILHS